MQLTQQLDDADTSALVSKHFLSAALVGLLCASAAVAQTTTLTFDGLPSPVHLQGGYADRVASASSGGFPYSGSGTFTPNVIAAFGAVENGAASSLYSWSSGYNNLSNVLYASVSGAATGGAELVVTFTADPGHRVSLEAFDLGNYGAAITVPSVRVVDQDGVTRFHEASVMLQATQVPQPRSFVLNPAPVGTSLSLRISLQGLGGDADNVGVDNVRFVQLGGATNEVGARYCAPATPNSSAGPGSIRLLGQATVAANDVRLLATGLPLGSFGFFLASRTQGNVVHAGGSQGVLCLGGAIGRYVAPGQVVNSFVTGNAELRIDLARTPTPTGLVAAQAGQTWNFTAWYRDANPGVTSNFTDAVALLLQ